MKRLALLWLMAVLWTTSSATTFVVNNNGDSGTGSLRAAITSANADASATLGSPHIIDATSVTDSVQLTSALPTLTRHIIINGASGGLLVTRLTSAASFRIFTVNTGTTVVLNNVTVRNGREINWGSFAGGINNAGTLTMNNCRVLNCTNIGGSFAGGINNTGVLTMEGCTVANCTIPLSAWNNGGGLYSTGAGTVTINNCTFKNNSAAMGGGVYFAGNAVRTITNSTFNNNQTDGAGAGIYNTGGSLIIKSTTISGNTNNYGGGAGVFNAGTLNIYNATIVRNSGGGISNSGTTCQFSNCIVMGNTGQGPDVYGTNTSSLYGHNIFSTTVNTSGNNNNITNALESEVYNTILANNGGSTLTHALVICSKAINNGTSNGAPSTDQRGTVRSDSVDIGAFESAAGSAGIPYIVKQPSNVAVCGSNSAVFTIEMSTALNMSYQWLVNPGTGVFSNIADGGIYSGSTTSVLTVSPSAGSNGYQYKCLVATTSCGYVQSSGVATLSYAQNPVITTQPSDFAVCLSGYKTITYSASGTALTYQWQVNKGSGFVNVANDANHSGATSQYLQVGPGIAGMNGWVYKVILTNSCGVQITSNPVILTIHSSSPAITAHPVSTSACVGNSASFTATSSGNLLTYQWQVATSGTNWVSLANSSTYSNVTTPTLTISGITASLNSYSYRCNISNACQGVVTNAAVLTVTSGATINTQPVNLNLCEGQNGSFSLVASGIGLSYQWQVNTGGGFVNLTNDTTYSNTTTNALSISNVNSLMNSYQYRCQVISASCTSIYTNTVTIAVGTVASITSHPDSVSVCPGVDTSFVIEALGTGNTYRWQVNTGTGFINLNNGGAYSNVSTPVLNISSTTLDMNNYLYRCQVTNSCTSTISSQEALLIVSRTIGVVSQPVSKTVCIGENAIFSITANGTTPTYQWQIKEGTIFVNLSNDSTYSGVSTSELHIDASADMNSSIYRCVMTNMCSTNISDSVVLSVNPIPVISSSPVDQSVCIAETANFVVEATGIGSCRWQVDKGTGFVNVVDDGYHTNSATTHMTVSGDTHTNGWLYRASINNGCSTPVFSDTASMEVMYSPAFTLQPNAQIVCDGGTASFNVSATGNYLQYQWLVSSPAGIIDTLSDGGNISGTNTPNLVVTGVTGALDGYSYQCVVSNPCASYHSFWGLLNVGAGEIISSQPDNQQACPGSNITFTVLSSDTSATYQWQVNNGGNFYDLFEGGLYANVNTNELSILGVPAAFHNRQFRCKLVTALCPTPVFSDVVVYQVPSGYPVITAQPEVHPGCEQPVLYAYVETSGIGLNYVWQVDNGSGFTTVTNSSTYSNVTSQSLVINPQPSMDGYLYRAIVSANTSCGAVQIYSEPVTLDANAVISIISQPTNKSSCVSGNTTFEILVSGYDLTYQWQVNDGTGFLNVSDNANYGGSNTSVLSLSDVSVAMNNYQYRVHINTPMCPGGFYSNVATLTINSGITILSQPSDKTVCLGNVIGVLAETQESGLDYQWQVFNGTSFVDLSNGDYYGQVATNYLAVVGHSSIDSTLYRCRISNGCLTIYTDTVIVTVNEGPIVVVQPEDKVSLNNSSVSFSFIAEGISLSYQWQAKAPGAPGFSSVSNGSIYSGVTSNSLVVNNPSFTMDGTQLRCIVTSSGCGSILTNTVNLSVSEFGICMVTVDETTGKNKIVYEVPSNLQGIDSFVVYREGNITNQYSVIGKTGKYDESIFVDTTSVPAQKVHHYKIAIQDSLGVISGLSSAHRSVHLMINKGLSDNWNLIWTSYVGKYVYSYRIYRSTDLINFNLLEIVAGSEMSFTDFTAPTDSSLYYQIEVIVDPCTISSPSLLKSNFAVAKETDTATGIISTQIYPNPASELVYVKGMGENFNYKIYDLRGYLLSESISEGNQINVQELKSGMYILETENAYGKSSAPLIKE